MSKLNIFYMFIIFQYLCYCSIPERNITMLKPETENDKYKLIKYRHKEYNNLQECFFNEVTKVNEALKKNIKDTYNDIYNNIYVKKFNYNTKDFSDYMVDKNNNLNDDEKFAIFIYTIWDSLYDFNFIKELSVTLSDGETGHFNCYFEYFFNALMKIKPQYDIYHYTLYKGNRNDPDDVYKLYEKLQKGDILKSRSFTSTGYGISSINNFVSEKRNIIFKITPKFRNARIIKQLSNVDDENEYVYLPGSEFKVVDEGSIMYCKYERKLDDCQKMMTEEYKYKYKIIELEEIGDPITSYEETDSPYSSYGIKSQISFWMISIVSLLVFFLI